MKFKLLKFLLIAFFVFTAINSNAQDTTNVNQPTTIRSLTKINLNLLGLTVEREQKIAKTTSLYFGAGMLGSFIYSYTATFDPNNYTIDVQEHTNFKFFPVVYTGVKHYYNIEKRIRKGKKTINNSANYVGLEVLGVLPRLSDKDYEINYQLNVTPQWGFQRSLGKKVNFELALGPTLIFTSGNTDFGASGKIAFGFLL